LRIALENLREDEAAGHAAEAHFIVERALGIVGFEVLLFRGAVAAVEGIEPGFERMPGGRIGEIYALGLCCSAQREHD
jgi:hypothetical protein